MNRSLLLALGSLLTLAACDGSSASPVASEDALAAATSDFPGNTPPGTNASPAPAPTPSTSTTATAPPPPSDPPMAKHCNMSSSTGDVCFENAQGHPGDVIDVDVIVIGDSVCSMVNEANSYLKYDFSKFVIQNIADVQDCRTRRMGLDINNEDVLFWNVFGEHVVPGCLDMPIGKVDTIKLKIAPGTPPGDYDITPSATNYSAPPSSSSACGWYGGGFAGKIRVLP